MHRLPFLRTLMMSGVLAVCVYPLASEASQPTAASAEGSLPIAAGEDRKQPSQSDQKPSVRATIKAPGFTKTIDYIGEPRLSQLTQQLRWQNVYWPSARLCTPALQQKLNARKAGLIAQLQLLATVYKNDDQQQLANATKALTKQVKRWPLQAHFAKAGEQGMQPALIEGDAQKNWLLQQAQQPYTLTVGALPQQVHWVGLTRDAGSYDYSSQSVAHWVKQRQQAAVSHPEFIWEVTLDGNINQVGLYPHNSENEQLQPGAVLYRGYTPGDLPDGFKNTNAELVDLLRYWQPGAVLTEQPTTAATCG